MEKYIALITNDYSSKHYMLSTPNESKERFIERVHNCYVKPYDIPYYDVEIYILGEQIDLSPEHQPRIVKLKMPLLVRETFRIELSVKYKF